MNTHQTRRRWQIGRNLLLLSCLGVPLVGGCKSTESADAAGKSADAVQVPVNSFAAAWRAELPAKEAAIKRLALLGDQVYAFTADNRVYWLNRESGRVLTVQRLADVHDTVFDPVALGDRVIFPSTKQLVVFDRKGKLVNRINTRYNVSSGAVADAGYVFHGVDHANGGRMVARDIRPMPYDTSPDWELMARGQISAAPAAYDRLVFAASRDGSVYAVRAENRAVIWPGLDGAAFKTGGPILADLKADKDGVFVASADSKLYCLDMNSGHVKWTYYAGTALREESTPVPTANSLYLFVPGTGIVSIDKGGRQEIRKPKWIVADAVQFLSQDDRHAYLRTGDNHIIAVDKQTGQTAFRSERNDLTIFATNTKDSTIYAARPDGELLAITPILKPGTVGEIVLNDRPAEALAARQ